MTSSGNVTRERVQITRAPEQVPSSDACDLADWRQVEKRLRDTATPDLCFIASVVTALVHDRVAALSNRLSLPTASNAIHRPGRGRKHGEQNSDRS